MNAQNGHKPETATTLQEEYVEVQPPHVQLKLKKPVRQFIKFVGGTVIVGGIGLSAIAVAGMWSQYIYPWAQQQFAASKEAPKNPYVEAVIEKIPNPQFIKPSQNDGVPQIETGWQVQPTPGCPNDRPNSWYMFCFSVIDGQGQLAGNYFVQRELTQQGNVVVYESNTGATSQYLVECGQSKVFSSTINSREIPGIAQAALLLRCEADTEATPSSTPTPQVSPSPQAQISPTPSVVVITPQPIAPVAAPSPSATATPGVAPQ